MRYTLPWLPAAKSARPCGIESDGVDYVLRVGSRRAADCRWARCDRLRCRRSPRGRHRCRRRRRRALRGRRAAPGTLTVMAPPAAGDGAAGRGLAQHSRRPVCCPPPPHKWRHRAPPPRRSLPSSTSGTARNLRRRAKPAPPVRPVRCLRSGCPSRPGHGAYVRLIALEEDRAFAIGRHFVNFARGRRWPPADRPGRRRPAPRCIWPWDRRRLPVCRGR